MNCPVCKNKRSIVIRTSVFSQERMRTRLCTKCKAVFTTHERISEDEISFPEKKKRAKKIRVNVFSRGGRQKRKNPHYWR